MRRLLFVAPLVAAMLVAGCASSSRGTAASGAAPAETPRIAPAVTIPADARRKVVLALTGPAAIVGARDWAEFKREWRETFAEHAKDAGVTYSFSETPPTPTGEDGTILLVDVADYRIVSIGARVFLGAMTGNAYIESTVKWSSLRDGSPFGEQKYSTSSNAWGGVAARVTPQQVDAIAANVFRDFGVVAKR